MRQVINQFSMKDMNADSIECPVSVNLWRIPGCHELLASLGLSSFTPSYAFVGIL